MEGMWEDGEANHLGSIYSKFFQYDGTLKETMPFGQGKLACRNGVKIEGTLVVLGSAIRTVLSLDHEFLHSSHSL